MKDTDEFKGEAIILYACVSSSGNVEYRLTITMLNLCTDDRLKIISMEPRESMFTSIHSNILDLDRY